MAPFIVHGVTLRLISAAVITLLETAEQGEDAAKKAYRDALQKELPLPVRQLLSTQYVHIQESHDCVKAARDSSQLSS